MLTAITTYLRDHGPAPLADIAAHVGADPAAVLPMLELLEKKGRLRRIEMTQSMCGSCTRCAPAARIEWAVCG